MNAVPKLTLDSNCVINLFDPTAATPTSEEHLFLILSWAVHHTAHIAITTRVEADLLGDKNEFRRAQMLKIAAALPVIGTIGRWDVSFWDSDFWADERTEKLAREIQAIVFPGLLASDARNKNKQMDIDHLVGHLINGRDVFVTDDKEILSKQSALRVSPGLLVMSPAECCHYLERLENRRKIVPLENPGFEREYCSPLLTGRVTFDYSNNDGKFIIGSGIYVFETAWSKASDVSIHAHSGSASVDALALAKGADSLNDITNLGQLDFSSRVRTAREGQILVWRNKNGFYAATRVLDVKDDSRDDSSDELTFEYRIFPEISH